MPYVPPQFSVISEVSGQGMQQLYVDEAQNKTRTQQLPAASGANEIFDYNQGKSYFIVASKCTVKDLEHPFRTIIVPGLYNYTGQTNVTNTLCNVFETINAVSDVAPAYYYSRVSDDAPVLLHHNASVLSSSYDVNYLDFQEGPQDADIFTVPKSCNTARGSEDADAVGMQ